MIPDSAPILLAAAHENERALLSCFMLSPVEVGARCAESNLQPQHFHDPTNADIYAVLFAFWNENRPIDTFSVVEGLRRANALDRCGGFMAVAELMNFPSAGNAEVYMEVVKEKFALRSIFAICMDIAGRAGGAEGSQDLASILGERMLAISSPARGMRTPRELVEEALKEIQDAVENNVKPKDVISTGFGYLDDVLSGGLRGDDTILITGPTKGGKSILAKNIAEAVSIWQQKPSLTFTLEMSAKSQTHRLFASQGRISSTGMRTGKMTAGELDELKSAAVKISSSPIYTRDDTFGLYQISAACRQFKTRFPATALFVVDYVQLVDLKKEKGENRENVVATISTTLRRLTQELGTAFIILSQENKQGDARESSRLEQDCTMRIKIEAPPEDLECKVRTITVPFARNAAPCQFDLHFEGDQMRFKSLVPNS